MWDVFSNFETILGFIGSIVAILTFFLALKVRRQVNEILDRIEFREKYKELSGKAIGFRDLLDANNLDMLHFKIQIFDYTAELKSKYSFFPRHIKKLVVQIEEINYQTLNDDSDEKIKLRQHLTSLSSYLEREAKQ